MSATQGANSHNPVPPPTANIENAKYSLVVPEEVDKMLPEAKKFLEVGVLDRFIGIFSSEQRAINAAKDLLAKPTQEISQAVIDSVSIDDNFTENINTIITTLNNQIYIEHDKDSLAFSDTSRYIYRINKNNYQQFLSDIQNGVFESNLKNQGLDPKTIQASIDYIHKVVREKTNLEGPLKQWDGALMLMEAKTTDALFKAVVTQAAHHLKTHETIKDAPMILSFIEKHAANVWADSSHQAFLSTIANELKTEVKTYPSSPDNTAIENILYKINCRAIKIAQIRNTTEEEDIEKIKQNLLDQLNKVPGFQDVFKKAQSELIQIVNDQRNLKKISAPQVEQINREIQMGENAIAATIKNIREGMDILQKGNIEVIIEAEAKAEAALAKLKLMNQFISPQESQNLSLTNNPALATNNPYALHNIITALEDDFLSIMDTLADSKNPSPTLLYEVMSRLNGAQVVRNIGHADKQVSFLELILGENAPHLDDIFEENSAISSTDVQLYRFKQHPQGIDALRATLKSIKQAKNSAPTQVHPTKRPPVPRLTSEERRLVQCIATGQCSHLSSSTKGPVHVSSIEQRESKRRFLQSLTNFS